MEQRAWLLSCTRDTWVRFRSEFLRLWDEQGTKGDAYPAALFGGDAPQGLRARKVRSPAAHLCCGPPLGRAGGLALPRLRDAMAALAWRHHGSAGTRLLACPLELLDWPAVLAPFCSPPPTSLLQAAQEGFLSQLWLDTVGFMGACMVRRIVGIAHVADMDSIQDADIR